ncbi:MULTISPECIES: hypothetical protein [Natrialbaceae]|uniref:hypothetical protein n=1 Tax=Natrialbaceae TaxID=1644061 RepID=UPI00207CB0E3|nr:hypothetical protein [Natronococcus sp. CG52]
MDSDERPVSDFVYGIPSSESLVASLESVELTEDAVANAGFLTPRQKDELVAAVQQLRDADADRYGSEQKVVFLDAEAGFSLESPVQSDKTANESDRGVAFVQGHRDVSATALREGPAKTSTLEES